MAGNSTLVSSGILPIIARPIFKFEEEKYYE